MKTIKELLGLEEAKDKNKMKDDDPCWDTHKMVGMKKGKGGKPVPNCVPKNEEVELDEASVTHIVAKKDLQKHKDWMDSEGFDTKTKSLSKSHPKHATHVGIVSSNSRESSYHEDGHATSIKEEVNQNKPALPSHLQKLIKDKQLDKKPMMSTAKIKDVTPKGYGPNEEVELDEAKVGDTVSFQHELAAAPGNKVKKSGTVEKIDGDIVHVKVKDKYGVKRHQVKISALTKEDVEIDEADNLALRGLHTTNPQSIPGYMRSTEKGKQSLANKNKPILKDLIKRQLGKHPKPTLPEGVEDVEEAAKVETAADVTKHFEKGQSTPSGVPKWVAEPLKKKKKVVEAGDPELMGGAVSKPTASGNNPKLADKFMKAFKKMKSPANISCKTVGMISTCEDISLEEEKLKKSENTSSKDIKKGEKLSGKQEPIKVNPDLKEK